MSRYDSIRAVEWQDNHLVLLDQRKLPHAEQYIQFYHASDVADAIRRMVVRGAPAIGIAAAYAIVLAARKCFKQYPQDWQKRLLVETQSLVSSRPTAVNLQWTLQRMSLALANWDQLSDPIDYLLNAALTIHRQDIAANYYMGELGSSLIKPCDGVITHCNTGSLATGGYGTALGVIRRAFEQKRIQQVYADETRPWWQGSRLTAWELNRDNIPVKLVTDNATAYLMQQKKVSWVIVGADRVAANGDVANKIGTYSLAINARYHNVRFMVVAPTSSVDMQTSSGDKIPIEYRSGEEVLNVNQQRIAALGIEALNPAFDITPAKLVDVLVTEKGIIIRPDCEKLAKLMSEKEA